MTEVNHRQLKPPAVGKREQLAFAFAHSSSIMAATSSSLLFDDIFTINAIDKEGKKFDRGTVLLSRVKRMLTIGKFSVASLCSLQKLRYGLDTRLQH